ncbi:MULTISPECIES: BtrH N-terminal domain-containing protein [Brevibacillus]|uniref:BtrH N-terminal domain-containing protein n=1 Tax=Brevibacillus TaxID=55080 RepID=UPI00156BBAD2|nr:MULTISPECIES: BtrH N-terminal domain-containing protein [Brevibacillus]MDR5002041.1 BtrH N-terminal domain-containing protein [Brevibacillus parabrevis]MED1721280.1 BtrH N-terminal domain-containing protein [Brevibacillus parabrevis]UED66676.1 BtrH N-terminal domain-containing protein [Brevibacillus sp. HD3.3A]WDV92921.1 BtrH N-terminal domain-containing protein [Brevibacillus parabrevis]
MSAILDIIPLHHDSRNCKEDTIVTVATWWKRDYALMFLESWGFAFDQTQWKQSGKLYQSITPGIGDMLNLLRHLHGIEIFVKGSVSLQDTVALVESELQESRPVAIDLDSYYCPWSHGYQKYHSIHTCLIVGADKASQTYTLVDCFYERQNVTISIADCFRQECRGIALFRKLPEHEQAFDWKQTILYALKQTLYREREATAFEKMREFADVLQQLPTVAGEFNDSQQVWMSPLLSILHAISNGRKHFASALQYVHDRFQIDSLAPLIQDLTYSAAQWSTVLSMLTKAYYQSGDSKLIQRAASKVRMVAELEEKVADQLQNICGERPHHLADDKRERSKAGAGYSRMTFIDLADSCNNKGFSHVAASACTADLTLMGEVFLLEDVPEQPIWNVNGMEFSLPALAENRNDNISCAGQEINVPEGYYSSLLILGCSECGSYTERIEILYEDNVVRYIPIQFTDWYMEPMFGETTAWVGKGAARREGQVEILDFPVRLLVQQYYLNPSRKMLRIKLPDCPNIHIFAMTLMAKG